VVSATYNDSVMPVTAHPVGKMGFDVGKVCHKSKFIERFRAKGNLNPVVMSVQINTFALITINQAMSGRKFVQFSSNYVHFVCPVSQTRYDSIFS